LLNPNMTPKLPDHPPILTEEIKFKNYICNKKSNILVFDYNIYCQIMNKFIIHSLRLLLPLIFGSWWHPYKTPAAVSQHFTLYLFSIWEISCWNLLPRSSETAPMFSEKKIQLGMQKTKFQWQVTPHSSVWWS